MFCRVARFYSLSPQELWKLPVKTFWLMHKNVDRLLAEDNLRLATVFAQTQSSEGFSEFVEGLREQMGTIAEIDEAKVAIEEAVFDRDGLIALKDLGRIG